MRQMVMIAVLILTAAGVVSQADAQTTEDVKRLKDEIENLRKQVRNVEKENELLKRELELMKREAKGKPDAGSNSKSDTKARTKAVERVGGGFDVEYELVKCVRTAKAR